MIKPSSFLTLTYAEKSPVGWSVGGWGWGGGGGGGGGEETDDGGMK